MRRFIFHKLLPIVLGALIAIAIADFIGFAQEADAKRGSGIIWVDIQPEGWALGTYDPVTFEFIDLAIAHDSTLDIVAPTLEPFETVLADGTPVWVWVNTFHDWGGPKPIVSVRWTLVGVGRAWLVDSNAIGQNCMPNAYNHAIVNIESQGASARFFVFDCDGFWEHRSIGVEVDADGNRVPVDVPRHGTDTWGTVKEIYRE